MSPIASRTFGVLVVMVGLSGLVCERSPSRRPLVLVDASLGGAQWASGRASAFEKANGRAVRVLAVERPSDAVQLASRGEAEVALVPASEPIDAFLGAGHGKLAGSVTLSSQTMRVLEVSSSAHPKVDGDGARALAAFLATNPVGAD